MLIVGKTADGKHIVRDGGGLRWATDAELEAEAADHEESARLHFSAANNIRDQIQQAKQSE